MTNTEQGYEFIAQDDRKYRTTGEFRLANNVAGEHWITAPAWLHKKVSTGPSEIPVIIVTPVRPTYEVTVTLDEPAFQNYMTNPSDHCTASVQLSNAIKSSKYRELK